MLSKISSAIPVILIVALGLIIYGNSLGGKFLWDDEYLIQRNTYIRSFSNIPKIFTQDIGAGSGRSFGFYRPLHILSYNIDYLLYRLKTWGYHLTNIILHILVALCLLKLFNLLFDKPAVSLAAALLFLAHPMNTATVSYMSGRADSMVNLFMLLSFIFYILDTNKPARLSYAMIFVTYAMAILTKENSLFFPALILLYHYAFGKKIELRRFAPLAVMALGYAILRFTALGFLMPSGPQSIAGSTTILQRLPSFFAAIVSYTGIFIVPLDLHMGRGMVRFNFSDPIVIAGILIFAGLAAAAFYFRKAKKPNIAFFGLMWFFIFILPVSNIYPINSYMAEHWLALPAIGLFLAAGGALYSMYKADRLKYYAIAILAAMVAFYGYTTIKQNAYWKDPITFHSRTLAYEPGNVKSMTDLARQYEMVGRRDDAARLYKRAIEINKAFPIPYNNLGLLYHNAGRDDLSVELYKKALELDPGYSDAINNLAVVYHSTGKSEEAIELYRRAIAVNPNFAGVYSNMGVLCAAMGKYDEALAAYKKAIEISPDFPDPYYNLGLLYTALGRTDEAFDAFKKALELKPDLIQANNNIGVLYFKTGQYDKAIKYLDKAASLGFKVDPAIMTALEQYRK